MAKLIFEELGETYSVENGGSIVEPCEEAGVPFACTEGVCGTCVVEVEEGMENLSPFNQQEADFLGACKHERLACQCKLLQGTVKLRF